MITNINPNLPFIPDKTPLINIRPLSNWLPWQPNWQEMLNKALFLEGRGNLYLVTDSHLGCPKAPIQPFIRMLSQLKQPDALLLLGDLFHLWIANPRFWTPENHQVIKALWQLKRQGVRIWCVSGNRDHLMPNQPTLWLPFEALTTGMMIIRWQNTTYGFTHGDLIRHHDHPHLITRYLSNSRLVQAIFNRTPAWMAKAITDRMKKYIVSPNFSSESNFPQSEIQTFTEWIPAHISHFVIGHFHRAKTFHHQHSTLHLAPPWLEEQQIGKISNDQPPIFSRWN